MKLVVTVMHIPTVYKVTQEQQWSILGNCF